MEQLKKILDSYQEIKDYVLRKRRTQSAEWFLIRDALDQSRRKDVSYTTVKLYVDNNDDQTRGHAEITLYPTHTEEEIRDLIQDAVASAKLIKNQSYVFPDAIDVPTPKTDMETLVKSGLDIIAFIYECANKAHGDLNSFEVFVNHSTIEILTKKGLHVSYANQDCYLEVIVNAKTESQEIELFKEFRFGALNKESLGYQFEELFTAARDRAIAQPTPCLVKTDLILSNENVEALLGVYESSTNVASLYNHTSNFKLGEKIQSEIKGDAINLRMVDVLEGSIHNAPVDADGVVLVSCDVIKQGEFTQAWGDARHSCYMNVPVTGNLRNAQFKGGKTPLAEFEIGEALEVLDFSSFIVDDNTGDFSGEIRLGYHIKDQVKTPVSGGSISGNLLQLHHELYLSKETQRLNRYEGPTKLRLKNVSVAGIK